MNRLLLSLALLTLTFFPARLHAEAMVKLLAMHGFDCPPVSGCFDTSKIRGTVQLKKMGSTRTVDIVYYDYYRQSWNSVPANYLSSVSDQQELWTFLVPASVTEFAIAYHADGAVYWDNNGGKNYTGAHYGYNAWLGDTPLFFGPELQWTYIAVGGETLTSGYDEAAASFTGGVWVQNHPAAKTVTVVYTDDQWKTTRTVSAERLQGPIYPSGVELWSFQAPVKAGTPAANIEFAVALKRGNETFWDNNYGRNFKINSEWKFSR